MMVRRGGLCIARYGGDADVAWKVGRIMLRFRPIAPKPVAGGAPVPAGGAEACAPRAKRKGSGRDGRRGRKTRKMMPPEEKKDGSLDGHLSSSTSNSSSSSSGSAIITLPLMPETPERKDESTPQASSPCSDLALPPCMPPVWHTLLSTTSDGASFSGPVVVVAPRPVRPAGSWVTMECVTDTWRDGELGRVSDQDVRRGMDGDDACPGLISDECDRVTWVNDAYRKMVVGPRESEGSDQDEEEVRVALVTRGLLPASAACRAFTCRVRARYASRRRRGSLAAPCDVWRLENGHLAWRLDVKAALSLSMGT